jgi:hypothetical protein
MSDFETIRMIRPARFFHARREGHSKYPLPPFQAAYSQACIAAADACSALHTERQTAFLQSLFIKTQADAKSAWSEKMLFFMRGGCGDVRSYREG